jgi:L-ascorbate metabolism protein UlaG (beta-lactamase superfamily)
MRLSGLRNERAVASPQFRGGSFRNTFQADAGLAGPKGPILREFLFGGTKRKPPGIIPVASPLETWGASISSTRLRVTWLGHSTMLLEADGLRVLTDPVFGSRLGPVSFAGPKRFHAPPVTVPQLPKLDAILVSHDHFDHLCKSTVIELAKLRTPFITSLGVGHHLEKFGVSPALITELDWHESHTLAGGTLCFTATPAQHFSGRIGGRNATLWSSWVIQTASKKLFFSGDTGLTPEMGDIGRLHGPFDLVMLEIGAWHPAWGSIHLGPGNALKAFELLGGGTLMPVHWTTFDLGLHPWAQPAEHLVELARAGRQRILTPRIGVPFEPALVEGVDPWWRDLATSDASAHSDDHASAAAGAPASP